MNVQYRIVRLVSTGDTWFGVEESTRWWIFSGPWALVSLHETEAEAEAVIQKYKAHMQAAS